MITNAYRTPKGEKVTVHVVGSNAVRIEHKNEVENLNNKVITWITIIVTNKDGKGKRIVALSTDVYYDKSLNLIRTVITGWKTCIDLNTCRLRELTDEELSKSKFEQVDRELMEV